jgi:hypothetical protein
LQKKTLKSAAHAFPRPGLASAILLWLVSRSIVGEYGGAVFGNRLRQPKRWDLVWPATGCGCCVLLSNARQPARAVRGAAEEGLPGSIESPCVGCARDARIFLVGRIANPSHSGCGRRPR